MTTPDVTVIVPVYNTMPYLKACLDSLLDQTIGHERLEVVAVDDGSTDGSGELLDEYRERHPDVMVVVHQENSGGPARPCNVGLDHARGRYVFFIGADDYLGHEALERMVTAADGWESDVVCVRMVGVGGRWVRQTIFAETLPETAFPSRLLATALSNTKLFRREVLERHGIRYALDLKVGSDQPFTVEAMLHAGRISVLADYDYYFAVRREDEQNITYTSDWRSRLDAMTAVIEHVADLLPPGEGRDAVLHRHFEVEIGRLLRRDFTELHDLPDEQDALVRGVLALVDRFLTPGITAHLKVLTRLRYQLVVDGDLDGLRALEGAEEDIFPIHLDGDDLYLAHYGFRGGRYPDDLYRMTAEKARASIARAIGPAEVSCEGTHLVVRAPTGLDSPVRLVAVRAPDGRSRRPTRAERATDKPRLFADASVVDGRLTGRVDLGPLLEVTGESTAWALRFQVDTRSWTYSVPVLCESGAEPLVVDVATGVIHAGPDPDGRLVVSLSPVAPRRERTAWWRRSTSASKRTERTP